MRLISCHIENFGKLSDYAVEFNKGQNIICEENGWGKSTFAAFIRAMFYGFDGEQKRTNEAKERMRYKPWQGGVFGGKLSFETNGKKYTITRIFGEKEKNDTFELRDAETNLISTDYTSNIGEELFKINRASFIRTVFIGQNEIETGTTDDINAKIGNVVDNSNDLNCYEKANAALTELLNSMTHKRVTGSIAKRTHEITSLERAVQSGNSILEAINNHQILLETESESLETLLKERKETEKLQFEVSKLQTTIAKKEEWERLKEIEEKRRGEVLEYREKFPKEIPAEEDIKKYSDVCLEIERLSERVALYCLDDLEKQELERLSMIFSKGVPTVREIDEKLSDASELIELKQENASERMSKEEKEQLSYLHSIFAEDKESASSMIMKWNTRNTKKSVLPSNQAALTALEATRGNKDEKKKSPIVAILGLTLIVLSIIAIFAVSEIIGAIGSVLGTILAIVGFVLHKKQTNVQVIEESPQIVTLKRVIEEDGIFIEKVDAEIKEYLQSHHQEYDEYLVASVLQELVSKQAEYERLLKKYKQIKSSTKANEIARIKEDIDAFLKYYGVITSENQFSDELHTLKSNSQKYSVLREKQKKYCEAKLLYNEKYDMVCQFLETYGWIPMADIQSQLKSIYEMYRMYENAKVYHEENAKELKDFEEKNDVSQFAKDMTKEGVPSLETLNEKLQCLSEEADAIRTRIQEYNRRLEGLQVQYEEWEETKFKLEELYIIQKEEKDKFEYITKAKMYLTIAKESMTSKYARPIFESFSKYFEMITKRTTEHYHISANTEITVEEHGVQRKTTMLSAGYRDLVGLCLRLALVDAMYQEEHPVIIMDDPFVNLDDEKVMAAKEFLKDISEKYQIIYFTCSNARK